MKTYKDYFNQVGEEGLRGVQGHAGVLYLADYILRRLEPPHHSRLLDAGCGDGRVLLAIHDMRPDLECWGLDFAETQIAKARAASNGRSGIRFEIADLKSESLPSLGEFHTIYSFSVLQYFTEKEAYALTTLLGQHLTAGGRLGHLSVPDLRKRLVLFQNDYLDHAAPGMLRHWLHLMKLAMVELKRRSLNDRRYGDSWFHDAEALAAKPPHRFSAEVIRPSDSWYRFDLLFHKKS